MHLRIWALLVYKPPDQWYTQHVVRTLYDTWYIYH